MIELFADIPQRVRDQSKFLVDMALIQGNIMSALKVLEEYRNSCTNEREKEFFDFYVNLRIEELKANT